MLECLEPWSQVGRGAGGRGGKGVSGRGGVDLVGPVSAEILFVDAGRAAVQQGMTSGGGGIASWWDGGLGPRWSHPGRFLAATLANNLINPVIS